MATRHEIRTDADRERAAEAILGLPPGKWAVEVKRLQNRRTLDQNASETGHDAEEVHEAMKRKFIAPAYGEVFGEFVDRRSTTDQTTGSMADYLNRVHAFATTDLGIHLPLPEERHAA